MFIARSRQTVGSSAGLGAPMRTRGMRNNILVGVFEQICGVRTGECVYTFGFLNFRDPGSKLSSGQLTVSSSANNVSADLHSRSVLFAKIDVGVNETCVCIFGLPFYSRHRLPVPTRCIAGESSGMAAACAEASDASNFRITVVAMTGAAITVDDASAADTILSVKRRVFAANRKLFVRRQRLVYRPGPHGMEPLADDETLGGAGVAQDGSAELDVLLAELTEADAVELDLIFFDSAKNGRTDEMLELLDEGANIEFQDMSSKSPGGTGRRDGYTALMWATENGHADCVRLLIDAGANIDATSEMGETALVQAAAEGRTDCVRMLIDAGARMDAMDEVMYPALIAAATNGRTESVRLLIDAGADIEVSVLCGWTALTNAADNGHTECARLLIEAGADKEAKDYEGRSSLNFAARNGHVDCVRLLIESGAYKNARDKKGRTALIRAVACDQTDCVRVLLNAGANRNAKTRDGQTALDVARARRPENAEIVRLLMRV